MRPHALAFSVREEFGAQLNQSLPSALGEVYFCKNIFFAIQTITRKLFISRCPIDTKTWRRSSYSRLEATWNGNPASGASDNLSGSAPVVRDVMPDYPQTGTTGGCGSCALIADAIIRNGKNLGKKS